VEYAFNNAMRPWSDGTPFRNKLRRPETLCRLLPDIEAAVSSVPVLPLHYSESPSQEEARLKARAEANPPPPLTPEQIAKGNEFAEHMRRRREAKAKESAQ
jgi:hypothetical protein